jgi:hypothetical protein
MWDTSIPAFYGMARPLWTHDLPDTSGSPPGKQIPVALVPASRAGLIGVPCLAELRFSLNGPLGLCPYGLSTIVYPLDLNYRLYGLSLIGRLRFHEEKR